MSRIPMIAVGAALVLFVYQGVTVTDTHVGAVAAAIQATLESEMEFEWLGEWFIGGGGLQFVEIPALAATLLLLFGGLPLAVFGLLLERQWAGVLMERRRSVPVPYAVLTFQIVSMAFSGVLLALIGPELLWPLSSDYFYVSGVLWLGYLATQILASIAVIPVWRRLLSPMGQILQLSGGPAVSA